MTHSWNRRNDEPDRIMSAFIPILTNLAQEKVMDEKTLRIREDIAEARSRPGAVKLDTDAVLSDLEYLLEQNAQLDENYRLARASEAGANQAARKAQESNATQATMINGLATQITNAMNALEVASITDVGGPLETRLARRVEKLRAQRKRGSENLAGAQELRSRAEKELSAAKAIIAETHGTLNSAGVPQGGLTLMGRVDKVLDERAGRPLRPSGTRSLASEALLGQQRLHVYKGGW